MIQQSQSTKIPSKVVDIAINYNIDPIEGPDPKRETGSVTIYNFNPPFLANVSTNVGKGFFKLIDTVFQSYNTLNKLFNRNTVEISLGVCQTWHRQSQCTTSI